MLSTTCLSLLVAGLTMLSQMPATYAAPVPSQANSAGIKRVCFFYGCRVAEVSSNTPTTAQSPVNELVDMLIGVLQEFQHNTGASDPTSVVELSSPSLGPEVPPVAESASPVTEVDVIEPVAAAL
ncbi:hypothetical protein B0F90DRAFT_1714103 [Multifurca ochricompacta]|uniref:Uncharacterized protein n=1 Tax=Multifurca ochricompacta TaxID=376703 RepID=A0AAD4M501_9AGAM|nr:hypothetical protein B0F90DRAFT_1714103 [Multifurca ochricompacta]